MLNCTEESNDPNVENDEAEQTSHKKEKKFVFNHGGNQETKTAISVNNILYILVIHFWSFLKVRMT